MDGQTTLLNSDFLFKQSELSVHLDIIYDRNTDRIMGQNKYATGRTGCSKAVTAGTPTRTVVQFNLDQDCFSGLQPLQQTAWMASGTHNNGMHPNSNSNKVLVYSLGKFKRSFSHHLLISCNNIVNSSCTRVAEVTLTTHISVHLKQLT